MDRLALALEITITKEHAIEAFICAPAQEAFFRDLGDKTTYKIIDVLDWLNR